MLKHLQNIAKHNNIFNSIVHGLKIDSGYV